MTKDLTEKHKKDLLKISKLEVDLKAKPLVPILTSPLKPSLKTVRFKEDNSAK